MTAPLLEMFARYREALRGLPILLLAAVAAAFVGLHGAKQWRILLVLRPRRNAPTQEVRGARMARCEEHGLPEGYASDEQRGQPGCSGFRLAHYASLGALGLVCLAALAWAWHLRWLCDDAYISFRYADNWARGRGLVFNPGERVEGYTNFLWTALLAGAIRGGLRPEQVSVIFDLLCLVATLLVTARLRHLVGIKDPLPLCVLLLGANYTFASFGTSGLETMPATFLVTLAVERALAGALFSSGLAGVLAIGLHPDHFILYAGLGVALLLGRHRRDLLRYGAPLLLLYLPYFLLRWRYYGDFWPNTYYAKSGGAAYFKQGALYLVASFLHANWWGLLPLALYGAYRRRRDLWGRYLLIAVPLYLAYVAKIGGDYMVGRLCVAVFPLLALSGELALCDLTATGRSGRSAAWALFCLFLLPTPLLQPREIKWYLADERTHTPLASLVPVRVDSDMFVRAQFFRQQLSARGFRPRLADTEVGMLAYYSDLEVIDLFGLTDRHVAHLELSERSRPGHEKHAPIDYLFARQVDLSRMPLYPPPFDRTTALRISSTAYFFSHYNPRLAQALGTGPLVEQTDFLTVLDGYITTVLPMLARETLEQHWHRFFEPYYFSQADDLPRRRQFIDPRKTARSR